MSRIRSATLLAGVFSFLMTISAARAQEGLEVLARGPVHEAYAQPVQVVPPESPPIDRPPPPPVPEEPPEQRPEGDNVQWVPGYWSWDADRNDFLWVSGFWRVPPPGRQWVPGHWAETEAGYQWVPGMWLDAQQPRLDYLDPPPASLDTGPTVAAPSDDSFYVPGCWVYRTSGYVWRPGYWWDNKPGWVWTPSHYCRTPLGWVYVDGYWDRALENRGLLFAPVFFNQPLYQTPGYLYRPHVVVAYAGLLNSFFVRPSLSHYYFGDYYASSYGGIGFQAWCNYGPSFYDPLFSYYRCSHRRDPGWYVGLQATYLARVREPSLRPPHTLLAQRSRFPQNIAINQNVNVVINNVAQNVTVNNVPLVQPLTSYRPTNTRLTPLTPEQLAQQRAGAVQLRTIADTRRQTERRQGAGATTRRPSVPLPAATTRSPSPTQIQLGDGITRTPRATIAGPVGGVNRSPTIINGTTRPDTRGPRPTTSSPPSGVGSVSPNRTPGTGSTGGPSVIGRQPGTAPGVPPIGRGPQPPVGTGGPTVTNPPSVVRPTPRGPDGGGFTGRGPTIINGTQNRGTPGISGIPGSSIPRPTVTPPTRTPTPAPTFPRYPSSGSSIGRQPLGGSSPLPSIQVPTRPSRPTTPTPLPGIGNLPRPSNLPSMVPPARTIPNPSVGRPPIAPALPRPTPQPSLGGRPGNVPGLSRPTPSRPPVPGATPRGLPSTGGRPRNP